MTAALRRAATSRRLLVLAALLLTVGPVGGTWAYFSAQTGNGQSAFAAGWIGAPAGLAAPTVAGNGATLKWTTAASQGAASEAVYATDFGTTMPADCSTATYPTPFLTGLAAGARSANPDRGSGDAGNWICYQVRGVSGNWFTGASFSGPLQVGLVPTGIALGNTGNSRFDSGDSIAITFNQSVAYSGPSDVHVCLFAGTGTGVILLGDANGACGAATDTPVLGKLTGLTVAATKDCYSSSNDPDVAVGGTNSTTVTVVTGSCGPGRNGRISVSGPGAYVGAGTGVASTVGSASQCQVAGANQCRPSTSFDTFQ